MGSRSLVCALLLTSSLARGQEARHVAPGHVITEPSWVYSDEGKRRVDAWIQEAVRDAVKCRTENEALQDSVVKVSAEPGLTWRGALFLVGGGVALGVTAGILLGKRL